MATMITAECINCGACEPECPNTAIYQGAVQWQAPDGAMHPAISNDVFYIVPEKCTECVGFHDHEACAAVCPVDCCVPDPKIPETHEVLLARARALHPSDSIPDDAPSRFKKAEGAPEAAPAAAAASAGAVAPAVAGVPAVAGAPAGVVVQQVVATRAPRRPGTGKVERPLSAVVRTPPPTFAGELPGEFDEILKSLGAPRRHVASAGAGLALRLLGAGQGILGALPDGTKRRLEEAVSDTRFFNAQLATAGNVFLNFILYIAACVAIALMSPSESVFAWGIRWWVFLGFTLALVEAMWRLRESFFRGVPIGDAPMRGAVYGAILLPVAGIVQSLCGRRGVQSGVGFDGFYAGDEHFDEKIERARRYGEVYKLEERDDAYLVHLEFPRVVPPTSLGQQLNLPREMPDYEYDLAVHGRHFVVHGHLADAQVRKITGVAPAFPPDFTTRIPLASEVTGFRHRLRGKTLEVILPKAAA
jgi:ferredoxin